jgi:putative DNA primase/helicase
VGIATNSESPENCESIMRIFLTEDGQKANVPEVKMALGKTLGYGVWLDEPGEEINVTEGIETALAVRQVTLRPTVAALTASGFKNLIIPGHVKVVHIFGDNDKNNVGQKATEFLANRLLRNEGAHE